MKYEIGQHVICKSNEKIEGFYLKKQEFSARIIDIAGDFYICEDQDSNLFELDEKEIELNIED